MLHPDLRAALAVIPDSSRIVKLRGHDVEFFPISVKDYVVHALSDPQTAMAAFGVNLETGEQASPEEIAAARETLSDRTAGKLIALSAREPDLEELASNLTKAEKERCLGAAFGVTTGGDVAGFFGDVRQHLEMTLGLLSSLPKEPKSTAAKVDVSGTVTRSRSSSKPSKRSRAK